MSKRMEVPKSWTFKTDEVARGFDTHVREQLPWYDTLTDLIAIVAKHYLPYGGVAYDIGASTGNLGAALSEEIKARNIDWIGIDNADSMRSVYRAPGQLEICDAMGYQFRPYNLAVCFLSLMFFPVDKRRAWLKRLIRMAKPGGAVIIVDKEESGGGILSTALHRFILACKSKSGTNADDILKKEFSLCGIQNPLRKDFFTGLHAVEIFRFGDFAAWVIENKDFTAI